MCEAPIDIDNSASVSPVVDSPTGTSFTVTCVQGFTPSGGGTGNMECESSGAWSNEPVCEGNISFLLTRHLTHVLILFGIIKFMGK